MNPEDAAELEQLRRDVEVLGGDPNAVLVRAQGPAADFRNVGTSRYEYIDPSAPGAAPGEQVGPMSDELKHLGVVKPGPQGYDMVDTAALGFKNASATGELAREVEALRGEIAALGGNPDAVLKRANQQASSTTPRQGQTEFVPVDPTEAPALGGPAARDFAPRAKISDIKGPDTGNDMTIPMISPEQRYEFAKEKYTGEGDIAPGSPTDPRLMRPPQQIEYNNRSRERAEVANVEDRLAQNWRAGQGRRAAQATPGSAEWLRASQSAQAPVDRDERDRQEVLRMSEKLYGAEKYAPSRNAAIDGYLRDMDAASPSGRTHASPEYLMRDFNVDPETGEVVGNFSPEEIKRALQRREEIFL